MTDKLQVGKLRSYKATKLQRCRWTTTWTAKLVDKCDDKGTKVAKVQCGRYRTTWTAKMVNKCIAEKCKGEKARRAKRRARRRAKRAVRLSTHAR